LDTAIQIAIKTAAMEKIRAIKWMGVSPSSSHLPTPHMAAVLKAAAMAAV
jgi:hypothetical protein